MPQQPEIQNKSSNEQLLEVASKLLEQSGIDKDDFFAAISALRTAKEQNPNQTDTKKINYIDKTPVYDDVDAFIYKRGDTKSGIWYFRIWDTKRKKAASGTKRARQRNSSLSLSRK